MHTHGLSNPPRPLSLSSFRSDSSRAQLCSDLARGGPISIKGRSSLSIIMALISVVSSFYKALPQLVIHLIHKLLRRSPNVITSKSTPFVNIRASPCFFSFLLSFSLQLVTSEFEVPNFRIVHFLNILCFCSS